MIEYHGIDHLVLTVRSIEKSLEFYCVVLGMKEVTFGEGRKAILCGSQKINLHELNKEYEPKAAHPLPGSADICLIAETLIHKISKEIEKCGVKVIEGPVERTGAQGKILSIYIRDPDQNLIEISNLI